MRRPSILATNNQISASGGKFFFDDDQQWPDTQMVTYDYPGHVIQYEMRLWSKPRLFGAGEGAVIYGENGWMQLTNTSWKAFDADGFYMMGDAMVLADNARPELGLFFDGRVAEDFKLTSGTWVSVGTLRIAGITALAPIAQDIVVTGHDKDEVRFLVFPNIPACRALAKLPDADIADVLRASAVRDAVAQGPPVELEQREGRVARYSYLSIRRALAADPRFSNRTRAGSVWEEIARQAGHGADDASQMSLGGERTVLRRSSSTSMSREVGRHISVDGLSAHVRCTAWSSEHPILLRCLKNSKLTRPSPSKWHVKRRLTCPLGNSEDWAGKTSGNCAKG